MDAAADATLTYGMTVDVPLNGHSKKLSLYIYLMEQERDGPFVDSWIPRATPEYHSHIDDSSHITRNGFVWADLSHALSNPQSPVRQSSQPMMSALVEVFDTRGEEILSRIALMASCHPSPQLPPSGRGGDHTYPSSAPHMPAYTPPMGREHTTVGSPSYTQANVHNHPTTTTSIPPSYYSRVDGPGTSRDPSSQAVSPPNPYPQLPHVGAAPTYQSPSHAHPPSPSHGGALHSYESRAAVAGSALVSTEPDKEKWDKGPVTTVVVKVNPASPSSRPVEDGNDLNGVHMVSNDHDYSTHTQTQVERFILSSGASDDVAVTFLIRSELHHRVLRTTIAGCKCDDDFRRVYAKLIRGGRAEFVTFLRVQCHLFQAMRGGTA